MWIIVVVVVMVREISVDSCGVDGDGEMKRGV